MLLDLAPPLLTAPIGVEEILETVAALPIATWNYKSQEQSVLHLGPMAQGFQCGICRGKKGYDP